MRRVELKLRLQFFDNDNETVITTVEQVWNFMPHDMQRPYKADKWRRLRNEIKFTTNMLMKRMFKDAQQNLVVDKD